MNILAYLIASVLMFTLCFLLIKLTDKQFLLHINKKKMISVILIIGIGMFKLWFFPSLNLNGWISFLNGMLAGWLCFCAWTDIESQDIYTISYLLPYALGICKVLSANMFLLEAFFKLGLISLVAFFLQKICLGKIYGQGDSSIFYFSSLFLNYEFFPSTDYVSFGINCLLLQLVTVATALVLFVVYNLATGKIHNFKLTEPQPLAPFIGIAVMLFT